MNPDKAYLLGLIIGGGVFGSNANSFSIKLPYKQWGNVEQNPVRAGQIGRDIFRVVKPMLELVYGVSATFDIGTNWIITCDGDITKIKNELISYGVRPLGELRKNAPIKGIIEDLHDDNTKRRFIAGLADTIGSTTKSHRRFSDDVQIVSFEINGFQFDFVCDLCKLLYSVKCYPDQVLWNHPNFHSGGDPYYKSWKKGFKLRVKLDQYAQFGAFAFKTKAESAAQNRALQSQHNDADICENLPVSGKQTTVHRDIDSHLLPDAIRGGIYLHNKHVCAVMGCQHAPYQRVEELLVRAGEYVNPFPVLYKDTKVSISKVILEDDILKNREYSHFKMRVADLYARRTELNGLLFGDGGLAGYPINLIIQGMAFLLSAQKGELNGKRTRGIQSEIFDRALSEDPDVKVIVMKPDLLTALRIELGDHAVLVGAVNPIVYSKLISRDETNRYKLRIRPITEEDLQ